MNLHTIKPAAGSTKKIKRVGRGSGSGKGKTSTRGHKGANSRSGTKQKMGFEGGQMPLQRRVPKFGFTSPNRVEYKVINLDALQQLAETYNPGTIDLDFLKLHGMMSKNDLIKVLSRGEITSKLEVKAHAFSATAVAAIEKAGGKATVI